jgi:hypothetical protein
MVIFGLTQKSLLARLDIRAHWLVFKGKFSFKYRDYCKKSSEGGGLNGKSKFSYRTE